MMTWQCDDDDDYDDEQMTMTTVMMNDVGDDDGFLSRLLGCPTTLIHTNAATQIISRP